MENEDKIYNLQRKEILKRIDDSVREYFNCQKQLSNYPNDYRLSESMLKAESEYVTSRFIYLNLNLGPSNLFPGNIWENPQSKEDFDEKMIYLKQMDELNLFGAYHNSM